MRPPPHQPYSPNIICTFILQTFSRKNLFYFIFLVLYFLRKLKRYLSLKINKTWIYSGNWDTFRMIRSIYFGQSLMYIDSPPRDTWAGHMWGRGGLASTLVWAGVAMPASVPVSETKDTAEGEPWAARPPRPAKDATHTHTPATPAKGRQGPRLRNGRVPGTETGRYGNGYVLFCFLSGLHFART